MFSGFQGDPENIEENWESFPISLDEIENDVRIIVMEKIENLFHHLKVDLSTFRFKEQKKKKKVHGRR